LIQLILHLVGDYLTQSDWMAQNKTKHSWPAFCHAVVYSTPFLCLTTHIPALLCIFGTHFLIDRFRLARYVVFAKNFLAPFSKVDNPHFEGLTLFGYRPEIPAWRACSKTGYPPDRPDWLAVWLLIVADNTIHLSLNYIAIRWL
jgi:Protein of unknown function (DUF3307)